MDLKQEPASLAGLFFSWEQEFAWQPQADDNTSGTHCYLLDLISSLI